MTRGTQWELRLLIDSLLYMLDESNNIMWHVGTAIGAMPCLDDSVDYLGRYSSSQHNQLSSPIIERNPTTFANHVMSLLESRQQLEFKELLPQGSTRKTAGIAFHHILSEYLLKKIDSSGNYNICVHTAILSNVRELKVEQSTPYGAIMLKCSQSV